MPNSLLNNIQYNFNFISAALSSGIVLISLCCIYMDITFILSNFQWGLLFTVLMAFSLILNKINNISILSINSLLTLTIMLFLGGRFFAAVINPNSEIFEINQFVSYTLDSPDASQLFFLVITGIFALQAGQYAARFKTSTPKYQINIPVKSLQNLLTLLLPLFTIAIASIAYQKITDVLQFGYLGLYKTQAQEEFSSSIGSLLNTFFYVFIGIAFAYGKKYQKNFYFLLLCCYVITMLMLGARGGFGAFILFVLWLYGDFGKRSFSLLKFSIVAICAMILLNYLIEVISLRQLDTGSDILSRIHKFLYTQGITLMVFDVSMSIEDYPPLAYIQSFLPGSSYLASLFQQNISLKDASFAHNLASTLNLELYTSGRGLGWSIFSDLYLFSGRSPAFFGLLFFAFGYIITKLEQLGATTTWVKGLIVTISPALFFVARDSLSSIFPLAIYYTIITFLVFILLLVWLIIKRNLKVPNTIDLEAH